MTTEERGFDFNDITRDNWISFIPKIRPYLKRDIISLGLVWKKFVTIQHKLNDHIYISRCVSTPSLAWKYVLKRATESGHINFFY